LDNPAKKRVRKNKVVRRREIAEAALRLMGRYGFHGVTVARIAKTVGITNSGLYQHFHNREAVLWAATDLLSDRANDWVLGATGSTASERLANIADGHVAWSAARVDDFVRPVLALIAGSKHANMETFPRFAAKKTFDLLLPIVEQAQREGSIRPDVEGSEVAWAILMFAWAEDIAVLAEVDEITADGVSRRIIGRVLASYSAPVDSIAPEA
jgi:AcrR family transcriptional regulator